jgi:hypothetical protein
MHVIPKFVQIKHKYTCEQWSFSLIKIVHSLTCHWGGGGIISHLPSYLVVVPNNFSFITIRWADVFAMNINRNRLLHDIFHICPGISPRITYQARQRSWMAYMGRGLISGTIWKISCHNLFFTYFTLTFFKHLLLHYRKDLWTDKFAKKKSLRELPVFNLQIFLFRVLYNDARKCL